MSSTTSLLRTTSGILSMENEWIVCLQKDVEARTAEDVEIVYSQLKFTSFFPENLKVFENYPEDLLHDIALYTNYEEVPPHTTLFCPGDEGLFWYTVISGNLEMLEGDLETSKVNSICSLGEGSSFGESVIFGSRRETMIVTTEHCQLLCVEANHIRHIYRNHKEAMKHLVSTHGRPISYGDDNSDTVDTIIVNEADIFPEEEVQMSVPVLAVPESDLTLAGLTLFQIIHEHFSELVTDHQVNLYTYSKCCSGKGLIDWVLSQSAVARSRQQVASMWQALLCEGIIEHVLNEQVFHDDNQIFYRFVERPIPNYAKLLVRPTSPGSRTSEYRLRTKSRDSTCESPVMSRSSTQASIASGVENSPNSSPRSSISSLLEECFEVISQLGPESLIYSTLLKDPKDRNDDDIQLIYEELLHVKAFGHLSNAIKEELAAIVKLENHPVAGKFLFKEGDPSTSWYIILKGSVNLIIGNKGVVCTLQEGDDFGKLALLNNAPRTTSIQLREPNCCFLRIDSDDFRRILLSVEKNTVKLKEHGKEVLLLEKSAGGKYLVVKGTPQKMLEYLLTLDINPGGRDLAVDESFAQDFFLTYPAFMNIEELCDSLIKCYNNQAPFSLDRPRSVSSAAEIDSHSIGEQLITRRKRLVWAITMWIFVAKSEIVKDLTFQRLLQHLQDCLPKHKLEEQLHELNLSLMDSIKRSSYHEGVKVSNPSGISLPFQLKRANSEIKIELGICAVPPSQPSDKTSLRVHTIDKKCCRLHVKLGTTAIEIMKEACVKLELETTGYELCEIKSSGEKIIFKETDLSIATEMSVNGRLYVLPKDADKTIPTLPDQNQCPAVPFPESESSKEIAAHMTSYDWNLFSNIQQMEFIYQVFGRHRFSRITSNLDLLIRRFNEVQYWTVTEICKEHNLQKRVKVLQKFIKIASHCKSFNNLNSFFAIIVGLMNGAVSRLKLTWEKVSIKLRRRYEQFEALMDPSRNHRILRAYQNKLQPPIIPFIPLIVKDAFFLHEGNETFVDGLVNFEKMRMVASKVSDFSVFKKGTLPNDVRSLSNKSPDVQKYIRELKVIDNQQVLMQMSHSIEPSKRVRKTSS